MVVTIKGEHYVIMNGAGKKVRLHVDLNTAMDAFSTGDKIQAEVSPTGTIVAIRKASGLVHQPWRALNPDTSWDIPLHPSGKDYQSPYCRRMVRTPSKMLIYHLRHVKKAALPAFVWVEVQVSAVEIVIFPRFHGYLVKTVSPLPRTRRESGTRVSSDAGPDYSPAPHVEGLAKYAATLF
jgi:hypothetical protein